MADHIEVDLVVHLAVDDKAVVAERIGRRGQGLADDQSDQVIQHRFDVYDEQTKPLLGWYPSSVLASVNASVAPLEVLRVCPEIGVSYDSRWLWHLWTLSGCVTASLRILDQSLQEPKRR